MRRTTARAVRAGMSTRGVEQGEVPRSEPVGCTAGEEPQACSAVVARKKLRSEPVGCTAGEEPQACSAVAAG